MKITKKRHLEIAIENIPQFESPNIDLEQYTTPSTIVADILWNANLLGDIFDKNILDLGCGTGVFTISSLLLKGKSATGIDIDLNAIKIAKNTADKMNISNFNFINKDVYELANSDINISIINNNYNFLNLMDDMDSNSNDINISFDTAITNPPFGSQSRTKKGTDRIFMKSAFKLVNVIYSFHMAETSDFVMNYYEKLGGIITHSFRYKFPLLNTYEFHTQETKNIDVVVFRTLKTH